MLNGYSHLGEVALMIMADYQQHGMKQATHYTVDQCIEKVCFRQESVSSCKDHSPSYVWWHLGLNEDGEITPIANLGKLSWVPLDKNRHRYVWTKEVHSDSGAWQLCLGFDEPRSSRYRDDLTPDSPLKFMVEYGLNFNQRVLSRCVGSWHRASYEYDEYDMDWNAEIIYADASSVIDIPYSFPSIIPKSHFKGLRVLL